MLYNIKRKYMIMSVLWNNYKQRYKDMGNLPLVLVVVIICIVVYSFPMIITHMIAGGNKLFLGGVYLCDLLALIVLCVNIIRIDCRNLLSSFSTCKCTNISLQGKTYVSLLFQKKCV